MNRRSLRFQLATLVFALGLPLVAEASHFRSGQPTWVARPDLGANTVEFRVSQGWRRTSCPGSGGDGYVIVGDPGCQQTTLDFGDASSTAIGGTVVAIDTVNDWYLATFTVVHTYPAPNNAGLPWNAGWSSCCRIYAPQVNAPGTSFTVFSTVDLSLPDSSPISALFPIVTMNQNALNNIPIPVADADGDTITCRLATAGESQITFPPGPPNGGAVNPLTITPPCTLTWDTTGAALGSLWATQVIIEQSRGGNPPHGQVALEFLIEIGVVQGTPPQCDSPPTPTGVVNLTAGSPYSATIQGSDVDIGDTLTLNGAGVPPGATLAPGLPTMGGSPISSVLSWTPTLADVGPHPLIFSITDQTGAQALCGFTLTVLPGPVCGDNMVNQAGEVCDGTDDQACPGMCLPPGDPNECTCPGPPPLDHFKCYKTRDMSFPRFAKRTANLTDQFNTETVSVKRPTRFCNPGDKNGEGITDPTSHLMCYSIKGGPFSRREVLVRNQFGDHDVTVIKPETLCNPASKNGVPTDLDSRHFKCYKAKSRSFTPREVTVVDQFETRTGTLLRVKSLCNPVDKNGEGMIDPINHLVCYQFQAGPKFIPQDVTVVDQFAEQDLRSLRGTCSKRDLLCVPSLKNPDAPTPTPSPAPTQSPAPTPTQSPAPTPTPYGSASKAFLNPAKGLLE